MMTATGADALITPARFARASDATWPGAATQMIGGWKLRFTRGAGSRASSAWAMEPAADAAALARNVAAVRAAYEAAGLPPRFQIWPGDEALDDLLEAEGWERYDRSLLMARPATGDWPVRAVSEKALREGTDAMAIAVRTPVEVLDCIWRESGVGPARRAVLDRAAGPKAIFLGRAGMRPAGAMATILDDDIGVTQALYVTPEARGAGLGAVLMAAGGRFATGAGARVLAHAVVETNAPAIALYRRLGYTSFGAYHYRRAPLSEGRQ
ncbi:MAG: GNAT family N-acetyltransferase [Pseudomonadota bacterium]